MFFESKPPVAADTAVYTEKDNMAKFKSAGSKKATPAKSARGAIPCFVVIILGIVIMCVLFYYSLQSSNQ